MGRCQPARQACAGISGSIPVFRTSPRAFSAHFPCKKLICVTCRSILSRAELWSPGLGMKMQAAAHLTLQMRTLHPGSLDFRN